VILSWSALRCRIGNRTLLRLRREVIGNSEH
jgi:hypothetical protein